MLIQKQKRGEALFREFWIKNTTGDGERPFFEIRVQKYGRRETFFTFEQLTQSCTCCAQSCTCCALAACAQSCTCCLISLVHPSLILTTTYALLVILILFIYLMCGCTNISNISVHTNFVMGLILVTSWRPDQP